MKHCAICKKTELETSFGKDVRCLQCNKKRQKEYYYKHIDKQRDYALKRYKVNRESILKRNKKINIEIRRKLFIHYGEKCVCCGEKNDKFLTVDHIDGGGRRHRNEISGGAKGLYRWIIKNNYPKNFQILCYNCNCGKERNNGKCPHEEER
jgi:hypothetical protein